MPNILLISFALLDRTLGHVDDVDDTVKYVGDDVSDLEQSKVSKLI